ncbi:hypothetical protein EGM70_09895 [Enterobacteriaceae bacterium 89]|nr:hypothetical protein [Enterobacteriaceae bacterium 89]
MNRPWPKGEWLIASALNVHPSLIWPCRYSDCLETRLPRQVVDKEPKKS